MKRTLLTLGISLILILNFLAFTNPKEDAFLKKVASEYGQLHGGINLRPVDLLKMGVSHRESYGIFSVYSYEFGNIGVNYLGIGGMTFHIRSFKQEENQQENTLEAI